MSKLRLNGATSGYIELEAPAVADNGTLTLPTAAGGFGKVVAFKSVTKTDIFSASVAAGASTAVTGLSISHAVADAANKVYLIAQLSGSHSDADNVAGLIAAGGTSLAIGDGDGGNRTRIGSGNTGVNANMPVTTVLMADYTPGNTSSVTYDVRVTVVRGGTTTVYVNRVRTDTNSNFVGRSASALFLIEVAA